MTTTTNTEFNKMDYLNEITRNTRNQIDFNSKILNCDLIETEDGKNELKWEVELVRDDKVSKGSVVVILSDFQELILRILFVTKVIQSKTLINILRPVANPQTTLNNLRFLEDHRFIHKREMVGEPMYALKNKGGKLFRLNQEINRAGVKISKNALHRSQVMNRLVATRVQREFVEEYYTKFLNLDKRKVLSVIFKEYIYGKIYYEYIAIKKEEQRLAYLLKYNIPQETAIEVSKKRLGNNARDILFVAFLNNGKEVSKEMMEVGFPKHFMDSLENNKNDRFNLLYNFINDCRGEKIANGIKVERIKGLTDTLVGMLNNYLHYSDNKIRKAIRESIEKNPLDDFATQGIKNEYEVYKSEHLLSVLNSHKRNFASQHTQLGGLDELRLNKYNTLIEYLKKGVNGNTSFIEKNQQLKNQFKIQSPKKSEEIEYVHPTFQYLRTHGIYIASVKDFNVTILICDYTSSIMLPSLLFERIWLAILAFKEFDTRFELKFNVFSPNLEKHYGVKRGNNTLKYKFSQFNNPEFAGVMDKIKYFHIDEIETDRKTFYKEFIPKPKKEEDEE